MQAQANMPQLNFPFFILLNLFLASVYLVTSVILDRTSDDTERLDNRSKYYWYYHGIGTFLTFALLAMDAIFLWFAFWDAYRRIYLMK